MVLHSGPSKDVEKWLHCGDGAVTCDEVEIGGIKPASSGTFGKVPIT